MATQINLFPLPVTERSEKRASHNPESASLVAALAVIRAGCLKCGGMTRGRILPFPEGRGSMVCSRCTPKWQRGYLFAMTRRLRQQKGVA